MFLKRFRPVKVASLNEHHKSILVETIERNFKTDMHEGQGRSPQETKNKLKNHTLLQINSLLPSSLKIIASAPRLHEYKDFNLQNNVKYVSCKDHCWSYKLDKLQYR